MFAYSKYFRFLLWSGNWKVRQSLGGGLVLFWNEKINLAILHFSVGHINAMVKG